MLLLIVSLLITFFAARLAAPNGVVLCGPYLVGSWLVILVVKALLFPESSFSNLGAMFVFVFILAVVVGELLGAHRHGDKPVDIHTVVLHRLWSLSDRAARELRVACLVLGALGLVGALEYARALGFFAEDSLAIALLSGGLRREQLMLQQIYVPYISRIGIVFTFAALLLSVTYFFLFSWRWWMVLPLLSSVITGVSQSGRAGTLIVLTQFLVAWSLKRQWNRVAGYRVRGGYYGAALWLVAIAVVFIAGQIAREGGGDISVDEVKRVLSSAEGYLVGGTSAFFVYVESIMDNFGGGYFGAYTFSGLFDLLRIFPQATGIYDEYVSISTSGAVTNVYSAFRQLIDDFSAIGAVLLLLTIGLFSGAFVNRGMRRRSALWIPAQIFLCTWLVWTPLVSITQFNSILLAPIFATAVLMFVLRFRLSI